MQAVALITTALVTKGTAGAHHTLRGDGGAWVQGGRRAGLGVRLLVVDELRQPGEGALQVDGLLCNPAAAQVARHVLVTALALPALTLLAPVWCSALHAWHSSFTPQ